MRPPRFRLRTLLIAVAVAGAVVGAEVMRRRRATFLNRAAACGRTLEMLRAGAEAGAAEAAEWREAAAVSDRRGNPRGAAERRRMAAEAASAALTAPSSPITRPCAASTSAPPATPGSPSPPTRPLPDRPAIGRGRHGFRPEDCERKRPAGTVRLTPNLQEPPVSDFKDKVKEGIDDAARAAKQATDEAAQKAKDAAYEAGKKVEQAGKDLKDAGK
jgi:hypothetical protein